MSKPEAAKTCGFSFHATMLLPAAVALWWFLTVVSWGATNVFLLALLSVGLAVLPGLLYIGAGYLVGTALGVVLWMLKSCKNRVMFSLCTSRDR